MESAINNIIKPKIVRRLGERKSLSIFFSIRSFKNTFLENIFPIAAPKSTVGTVFNREYIPVIRTGVI